MIDFEFFRRRHLISAVARVRRAHRSTAPSVALVSAAFALHLNLLATWLPDSFCSPLTGSDLSAASDFDGRGTAITGIALGPLGDDVRLSGEIVDGEADRLEALLNAHPQVKRIHLTSEGGLTDEARSLGNVIARHGLVTYVPDYCVSACTLLFIRGGERLLLRGARLGFHAPYEEGSSGQYLAVDSSEERDAYVSAGVNTGFVDAALKTSPSDIWIPGPETLIQANVATGYVGPDRFPDSNLDGMNDGNGARAIILHNFPLLKPADARVASILDRAVAWYLAAYEKGSSEAAVRRGLERYAALVRMPGPNAMAAAPRYGGAREASLRMPGLAFGGGAQR